MNTSLTCSFFGHSKIEKTKELISRLKDCITNLTQLGVSNFYFGGFGEWDDLCYEIVTEIKKTYPYIKRYYCLHNEDWYNRPHKRPKYLKDQDYEHYIFLPLSFNYWYSRIYYRNCAMVDTSDFVIFYVKENKNSGAYKTYKYATKKKKQIINLFPENKF